MNTMKRKAILTLCDRLTVEGKQLSVYWQGGNDSGWLRLKLGDADVDQPSEMENDIIKFVAFSLGYHSFDGNFSSQGEVVYDRVRKTFSGTEHYACTDGGIVPLAFTVCLPENIWFDHLAFTINVDDQIAPIECDIELRVNNGPFPENFDIIVATLVKQLRAAIAERIDDIEDFSSMWEFIVIPRTDFQIHNGQLSYLIEELNYTLDFRQLKEISFSIL